MSRRNRIFPWRKCPHCGTLARSECKICPVCEEYIDDCWEELSKTDRNNKMIELLDSGDYTLAEVGEEFDISRQRVHQIYKRITGRNYRARIKKERKERARERVKERLSVKPVEKYCVGCGRSLKEAWEKHCRKGLVDGRKKGRKLCPRCQQISQDKRDPKVTFTCSYCGKKFHPFYNWRWTPGVPKFCCRECYYKSMKVSRGFKDSYETLPVFTELRDG